MHPRQAIRDAVVAQLVAANTAARDRVYPTREVPWRRSELPGIAVYALKEEDESGKRRMELAILLVTTVWEQVDAALDDLAQEVEAAIGADPSFGRTALASRYSEMAVEITEDQGVPIGAMRLAYDVWYLPNPALPMSSIV
jgi:hypothetical protein